jgi:hypothetical protein
LIFLKDGNKQNKRINEYKKNEKKETWKFLASCERDGLSVIDKD